MSEQGLLDTLKMLASAKLQATTGNEHIAWNAVWVASATAKHLQEFNEFLLDQIALEERNRDEYNGKIVDEHKLIYMFMIAFTERSFRNLFPPQYWELQAREVLPGGDRA